MVHLTYMAYYVWKENMKTESPSCHFFAQVLWVTSHLTPVNLSFKWDSYLKGSKFGTSLYEHIYNYLVKTE